MTDQMTVLDVNITVSSKFQVGSVFRQTPYLLITALKSAMTGSKSDLKIATMELLTVKGVKISVEVK